MIVYYSAETINITTKLLLRPFSAMWIIGAPTDANVDSITNAQATQKVAKQIYACVKGHFTALRCTFCSQTTNHGIMAYFETVAAAISCEFQKFGGRRGMGMSSHLPSFCVLTNAILTIIMSSRTENVSETIVSPWGTLSGISWETCSLFTCFLVCFCLTRWCNGSL